MTIQIQQLTIAQDNKIKKLEGELARKNFSENAKDKQISRLFNQNIQLKSSGKEVINLLNKEYEEVVLNQKVNSLLGKMKKLVEGYGDEAATAAN
jgi:hypothetical protein